MAMTRAIGLVMDAQRVRAPMDLTAHEREILGHVRDGATYREVGRRLHISPHTVKTTMAGIRGKLGAHSALHAVVLALRRGEIALREESQD
jgi:DNA-binding HTH domain-containing proteins